MAQGHSSQRSRGIILQGIAGTTYRLIALKDEPGIVRADHSQFKREEQGTSYTYGQTVKFDLMPTRDGQRNAMNVTPVKKDGIGSELKKMVYDWNRSQTQLVRDRKDYRKIKIV